MFRAPSPLPFRRLGADGLFDVVECADAVERVLGDGGIVGGVDVEELVPDMRPAGGFSDVRALEDGVEAGIAIGM